MNWRVLIIALACALAPTALPAQTPKTDDPVVDVELPKYYILRKKILFPLDAPGYIIHSLFKPLGVVGKYVENERIVPKVLDFLSNDEKTFFVLPSIRGESGHGVGFGVSTQYTNLFKRRYILKTEALVFADGDHITSLSVTSPPIDAPVNPPLGYGAKRLDHAAAAKKRIVDGSFIATWRRHNDDEFYGVGTATPASNRSEFTIYEFQTGFLFNYKATTRLSNLTTCLFY